MYYFVLVTTTFWLVFIPPLSPATPAAGSGFFPSLASSGFSLLVCPMRWLYIAAFLAFYFPANNVFAQNNSCGNVNTMKNNMALNGHKPWFRGLSIRGHLTEIWVNGKTDEFVAFVVYPDKKLCFVDMGKHAETTSIMKVPKGKKL